VLSFVIVAISVLLFIAVAFAIVSVFVEPPVVPDDEEPAPAPE
jgi:hypothetical protein